jgi:hypothetical protein
MVKIEMEKLTRAMTGYVNDNKNTPLSQQDVLLRLAKMLPSPKGWIRSQMENSIPQNFKY